MDSRKRFDEKIKIDNNLSNRYIDLDPKGYFIIKVDLVEKISDNNELIGRSYIFAPEIDGTVILSVKEKIDLKNYIGKFIEANIYFADEYDLYGETIKIF